MAKAIKAIKKLEPISLSNTAPLSDELDETQLNLPSDEEMAEAKDAATDSDVISHVAEEIVAPKAAASPEKIMLGDAKKMREILADQPKIRFFIPLEIGEKPGAQQFVGINGYQMWIPKGKFVDVPQQVAEMLAESMNVDLNAGNAMRIAGDASKESALS